MEGAEIFAYPRFSPARRSSPPTFLSNCYADWLPWVNDRCFYTRRTLADLFRSALLKFFPLVSGEGRGDEVSLSLDEFISENGLVR